MRRREFLAVSGAMGVWPLAQTVSEAQQPRGHQRDYYELRTYQLETQEQRKAFDRFAADAAIPALNRLGISPVGVFYPLEGIGPAYVLLTHPSPESVATLTERLANDDEFLQRGAAWLDAPATRPAYQRMESSLFVAFTGMPHLETPAESPDRVFQLRIYESPSVKTGQKKIEMFNDAGEIAIFRRVGLNPVFFGEALVGSKMPNLTYMLGFESDEDRAAAWKRFGADPQWQELRAMEEYADKKILSGITNLMLQPATYSQI
ncbi:MAG: NIPSNAP family containing protein [Planctomycetaceae bacterium]|nr:MAG: NIPSNAP family containing protein [Planctomycetaceae bacterium]